jgi:hypothetical protein
MVKGHKDSNRKWLWIGLGVLVVSQFYFVRELLAAFAIFFLGFAVIAAAIASLYFAQKIWETGVAQVWASRHPVMLGLRRAVSSVEEFGRRPIRRPADSQTAS